MANYNYLTCQELVNRYRKDVDLLRWNVSKIGTFHNCYLLQGTKFGKNKRVIIMEESFTKLISYAYSTMALIDEKPEYLSYDEVIERVPQAEYYHWTPTVIGVFFHSALLVGKKSHVESRNLVTLRSAENLAKFTHQRFMDIGNKPIQ